VDVSKGTFSVIDGTSGRAALAGAATAVELSDGRTVSSRDSGFASESDSSIDDQLGRGRALVLTGKAAHGEPELRLTIALYEEQPFAVMQSELVNSEPAAPVQVLAFRVLEGGRADLASAPETWRFYRHGWQSWSPTLLLDCAAEDIPMAAPVIGPRTQPAARAGRFVSEMMTAVVSPLSERGVVAGFVTTGEQMSQVWLDREGGRLTAASYADGITVPPGGRLSSEWLLLEPTASPLESMERYGDALGSIMGALPAEKIATGWCSWYCYWQGVTEGDILANLEELSRRRRELPLEYVQIDDGWQAEIGDWLTANEKFPHGLNWLVERIHERGFMAGLWLAPFLMGDKSRLWKEHPDWAIQYRPGKPFVAMQNWGQDCYALDLTRAEVIEWLGRVFSTVCEEWGFDYVKIDFIYAGAVDGIRHEPNVTRAQAYRRGLTAIREAVGDRFILACGNPIGPSVGLVDGARISPDVAPYWQPAARGPDDEGRRMSEPSALNAIRNTLNRWWMHGRLWQSDPDCLLVRDSETTLSADEVRTLATVIAMSGGMVLNSDHLTHLSGERCGWLAMLLPPYGRAARPVDLFEGETPGTLGLDCETYTVIAVFNWQDEPARVQVPLPDGPVRVVGVWNAEDLGERQESITLELPAHACALLSARPIDDVMPERTRQRPALLFPHS
jgi:alpha-galactosidase